MSRSQFRIALLDATLFAGIVMLVLWIAGAAELRP